MPRTRSEIASKFRFSHCRIVFFGAPAFGRTVLEALSAAKFKLVGVVTQPDRPLGREQKLTPSPVKTFAKKQKIPVFTPANKTELLTLNSKLSALKPDLLILAAYGMIIPPETLALPAKGALNVHPSLLPKYRGPSPIQAAILSGERETGVTIILMDEEVDHGPILTQRAVPIAPGETLPTLTGKLALHGGELLLETIPDYLSGKITPQPQDPAQATFTKLLKKEDGEVNWGKTNPEIERMIRALNPWPGVWTTVGEMADQLNQELRNPKHGKLKLKLLTADQEDGALFLETVQVEGRNPISFSEFASGYLA